MSKQRATELRKIRDDLKSKFDDACSKLDSKITEEENDDGEKTVAKAVRDFAKTTDSTAAGIAVARMFPQRGGPR